MSEQGAKQELAADELAAIQKRRLLIPFGMHAEPGIHERLVQTGQDIDALLDALEAAEGREAALRSAVQAALDSYRAPTEEEEAAAEEEGKKLAHMAAVYAEDVATERLYHERGREVIDAVRAALAATATAPQVQ